jgi:hypothetical protein
MRIATQIGDSPSSARAIPGRALLRAVLVPADCTVDVAVIAVPNASASISEAIGGHLLDDTTTGVLPGGARFTLYLADAPGIELPDNPRAAVLAARLGLDGDRALMARLCGDLLITGLCTAPFDDIDVPDQIEAMIDRIDTPVSGGHVLGWVRKDGP